MISFSIIFSIHGSNVKTGSFCFYPITNRIIEKVTLTDFPGKTKKWFLNTNVGIHHKSKKMFS